MERSPSIHGIRPILLVAVTLLTWEALRADEPWMAKTYSEWDRNAVRQILFNSPWVRHFRRTRRALEFEVPDQGPSGMELRGYHAKESKEDGAETSEFYVRWVSSRTLRRAWAQTLALIKKLPVTSAENSLPPAADDVEMNDFEIAVAGPDMSGFEPVREAALRAKCYLAVQSKRRVLSTRVELVRSSDGSLRGLLFHFPRRTATGEPIISSHDTKVWFIEYAGSTEIRVMFNPQTMVDGKGLDL
jgi:hypothetical protein